MLFALSVALLPLANKITGPVDGTIPTNITGPANGSIPDYLTDSSMLLNISNNDNLWSGSGVGSNMNEMIPANSTNYCGNDANEESLVNENSIKRIPGYVWVVLSLLLGFMVVSRCVQ